MKVLFVHPNFPAQFGHVAQHLTLHHGWKCTCISSVDTTRYQLPFDHGAYNLPGKPVAETFFNPDTPEELKQHMEAVYVGLKGQPQIRPDLVVGHMSYGTMLYLKNLYPEAKFVGYFEILPGDFWTDALSLRKDFPATEAVRIHNATYHFFTHLHLHCCDAGYTPTQYQFSTCPPEYRHKLRVIHDGIDCDFFSRKDVRGSTGPGGGPVDFRGLTIRPETRVITYVSRGLESARGFDIFMRMAKKVYQAVPDVLFLVAGGTRTNYGHEGAYLSNTTFKDWVLAQDDYDLSKFAFLGHIPPTDLKTLYDLSDLHVYLTAPYVLSWSLLQAMANGCVVLGSKTAPVEEVIEDNWTGLLADFYDADALAERAVAVLRSPAPYRYLGDSAAEMVRERYEKTKCVNQLVKFFGEVAG